MNRFRTKKKAREEAAAPRPSVDTESSGPFKMFGKGKKSQEEPKKEVDIAAALPPSDDFRTSLLMTGLSARFSMLRDADDPHSKMGKASDDSVIFKRQSRMDFGLGGGLDDIAEVESIKAPPFARMDSFYSSDDNASMSGSIMNRGKPTEGNNLFGGRQKIYKISAGVTGKTGGMPGRALYEDDVALSSFQRWKQAERERRSLDEEAPNDTLDTDPQLDYNRRRETNSTTSSVPSGARNSTAATSVASSQPAPSLKDLQPQSMAPTATSQGGFLERNVTRTRRLYEQSLTQDLHDQQSSAVSRMDTLSKRSLGARTPDLTPTASSPTSSFNDRHADRRAIVGKASAPNLRSFSPPTTGSSQASPAETGTRMPGFEQKTYGTTPPLSPPISETEEQPVLAIQPNDRGKATAMGVFNRPMQQYDDSKYAQRQRQMQQGRETPTNRFRADSNTSLPTSRSRSSSSLRRPQYEKPEPAPVKTEPTVQEETNNHTFFDDDEAAPIPKQPTRAPPPPQVTLERPNDQDHPAFRKSALPTPLTVSRRNSTEALPTSEDAGYSNGDSKEGTPEDSPTLGPPSGLSGMVRQHLRNASTASSVYGAAEDGTHEPEEAGSKGPQVDANEWGLNEAEWDMSYGEVSTSPGAAVPETLPAATFQPLPSQDQGSAERETDDFARHLADGARRVREKMTSSADPDSGRSTPLMAPSSDPSKDLPPPRPSGMGFLRPKSSGSSLADRDRETDDADYSTSGNRSKRSMDVGDESRRDDARTDENPPAGNRSPPQSQEKMHAGLKAFRQARRELQKMKQMDTEQRRQGGQKAGAAQEQAPSQRSASREAHSSRSASRPGSSRDRSGSEASNGMHSYGQVRGSPAGYDDYQLNGAPRPPVMRSPVPPPTGAPPAGPYRTGSSHSLNVQPQRRGYDSGNPSPISPANGPAGHYSGQGSPANGAVRGATASTPNLHGNASAPPLPPINPRRKNARGGSGQYGEDEDSVSGSPRIPASPEKQDDRASPLVMSDEGLNPEQFRQRLRKVPVEANGMDGRTRTARTSPPRSGSRPPPPKATMSSQRLRNGLPGGMI